MASTSFKPTNKTQNVSHWNTHLTTWKPAHLTLFGTLNVFISLFLLFKYKILLQVSGGWQNVKGYKMECAATKLAHLTKWNY
jgi:hypothetical protein